MPLGTHSARTRAKKKGTGRELGAANWGQGTWDRELGTGNWGQGTGTGNWGQGTGHYFASSRACFAAAQVEPWAGGGRMLDERVGL